jgi:hypothetical protein
MIDIGAALMYQKNATPNELIKTITEVVVNGFITMIMYQNKMRE